MKALIVVTDLGRMKVYRIRRNDFEPDSSPVFEDLADVDLANQHSRVSDRMADKAGRFSYGAGSKSVGERHHEQGQAESVQLASIVNEISQAVEGAEDIYLAAPNEIMGNLLSTFEAGIRGRIRKSLTLNLVKAPKLDLLDRFGIQ